MRQDLIYTSRRFDNAALSRSEIFNQAPAILAEGHAEGLSRRYGEVSTLRALEILEGNGWAPVQAAQKKARKPGGQQFAAHLVAFADTRGGLSTDKDRPEVILYNSHDGSSSVRLFVGFYRMICSNGIVAGQGFEARIRHTSGSVQGFETMLSDVITRLPGMVETIQQLKARTFTRAEQVELARRGAALRWDPIPTGAHMGDYQAREGSALVEKFGPLTAEGDPLRGLFYGNATLMDLLTVNRSGDQFEDAWTVLNRVQEGVIRTGARVRSITDRNAEQKGIWRKARGVNSVSESVRINRGLWDAALEVAGIDPSPAPVEDVELLAA